MMTFEFAVVNHFLRRLCHPLARVIVALRGCNGLSACLGRELVRTGKGRFHCAPRCVPTRVTFRMEPLREGSRLKRSPCVGP